MSNAHPPNDDVNEEDFFGCDPAVDFAETITELIESYEQECPSFDGTFNMEVRLVDGTRMSLPYCQHGSGFITLMDDTVSPPRPRVIQSRHVTEVSIDATCRSTIERPRVKILTKEQK